MNELFHLLTSSHTAGEAWVSLLTLVALEVVLGIDNIVFITILAGRLPKEKQKRARRLGLSLALLTRLGLLYTLSWIMQLTRELVSVMGHSVTGKDLILLGGGLFLMGKAVVEIYDKVEAQEHLIEAEDVRSSAGASMASVLVQIMVLDIVFSLDSVITAVGMVPHLSIMATAVVIAVLVMLVFAGAVGDFVEQHPSMKILALSFLVMIGMLLVAEGAGQHFPKGYAYFGMAFSLCVELLNMRYRRKRGELEGRRSVLHEEAA